MYDPDDRESEGVSLACRAVGATLEKFGETDLAKMSPVRFRAVIKAAIVAWETQRLADDIPF
jgi:hypothetical protein